MDKIYLKDVPQDLTIQDFIQKNTDISNYYSMTPKRNFTEGLWSFDLPDLEINFDKLPQEVEKLYHDFKFWGWTKKFQTFNREDTYGGLSLTYNPERKNSVPWQVGLLGEIYPRFYFDYFESTKGQQTWAELIRRSLNVEFDILTVNYGPDSAVDLLIREGIIKLRSDVPVDNTLDVSQWDFSRKNSYYDTLSFRYTTEAVRGEIKKLFDHCQRTIIRSRVMTLKGERPYSYKEGWHRDEDLFINTRVLLAVTSNEYFKLKIEGFSPRCLETNRFYTFNSRLPHGISCEMQNPLNRHLIVLGFCPWFDYLEEENAFIKNEFYGKMHPYDMLLNGQVYKSLKVRNEY